jgi:hypothetical protein
LRPLCTSFCLLKPLTPASPTASSHPCSPAGCRALALLYNVSCLPSIQCVGAVAAMAASAPGALGAPAPVCPPPFSTRGAAHQLKWPPGTVTLVTCQAPTGPLPSKPAAMQGQEQQGPVGGRPALTWGSGGCKPDPWVPGRA